MNPGIFDILRSMLKRNFQVNRDNPNFAVTKVMGEGQMADLHYNVQRSKLRL